MDKLPTIFSAIKNIAVRKDIGGAYVPTTPGGGWYPFSVREPFTGAWQHNIEWKREGVLSYHAIFACITLIAADISKLRVTLTGQTSDGIWQEIKNTKFPVIDDPNDYQNRIQFFESWLNSKLIRGNTYVLLERTRERQVKKMYVLNPDLVLPAVTPEGEVFYQLGSDNLAGIVESSMMVPASDIIHDRFNCLCHPLVGLSPIFASGLAAFNGLKIQKNSANYFQNMSRPSGILTAPGSIKPETATALKDAWEANYSNDNYGRIAVLGDDLKYMPLALSAEESQMVEQQRLNAEIVCSAFHVPKYKIIGDPPTVNNIEALEQSYYSQCLQPLIEAIELLLNAGLGTAPAQGFEFDLDGLLRMDTKTQIDTLTASIKGGLDTPNEARKKRNQPPLPGGGTVWMQQQQWPMEVLFERRNPPADSGVAPAVDSNTDTADDDAAAEDDESADIKGLAELSAAIKKEMENIRYDA